MLAFTWISWLFARQALYRDALSKRLLNNKTTSMDMEKHMVTKLKLAQGPPFTRNIEVLSLSSWLFFSCLYFWKCSHALTFNVLHGLHQNSLTYKL